MPEKRFGVNDDSIEDPIPGASEGSTGVILVYATFPDAVTAERIARELVGAQLAACVNLIPGMRSVYRWEGAVQCEAELSAIIKTRSALLPRVLGWVRIAHPYVNPALVALPVLGGSPHFLEWIVNETS